jgi:hypothetical protein
MHWLIRSWVVYIQLQQHSILLDVYICAPAYIRTTNLLGHIQYYHSRGGSNDHIRVFRAVLGVPLDCAIQTSRFPDNEHFELSFVTNHHQQPPILRRASKRSFHWSKSRYRRGHSPGSTFPLTPGRISTTQEAAEAQSYAGSSRATHMGPSRRPESGTAQRNHTTERVAGTRL